LTFRNWICEKNGFAVVAQIKSKDFSFFNVHHCRCFYVKIMIVALTNATNWLGYHGVGGIEQTDSTKLLLLIHSIALNEIPFDRSSP
jgi:hypothetical protein